MTRKTPKARPLSLAFLLLAFVALATTGSHCAKVSDPVASPDEAGLSPQVLGTNPCVHQCIANFHNARLAETALHKSNVAACLQAPDAHECLRAENARHLERVRLIGLELRRCLGECHNQGFGHGGD